ncbi:UDP-N-acetylglucosamine--N-acetylmuramyl-(pentapeptide) pyrophosphoryl-undecaprenol N-acetylglucosamine transferase [Corynebacterium guangdongense]|uniref:UDP-N-acetylglucosamine--N-acetylmuramyl-(pentapeptide) pyrophosphoryl-undecaprenol N-acetylglucosamine transferase n=1 Tax=Corynebacterium guangdongense TaxID=1783348 RepID=A0ABU1ZXS8_9CORY|nr:UDP-N-acetylglucosamine--N-acetylmuramyl-(pentapeptide) pyrophosphoryl-undecaprenol N-acetylglucosamine transferase [Corynebacterium guangdongense]MDR7329738.1 UDP-N-acetylglucosamine--N-acetylmuramyl-(pentapeptide) pyrophosphoryl-undecaprenol N-acetylglucosamine transferase [Corynebacterium guangdongense]WJZ18302.1 UDP-N-acetylglucosamine--N-acetylmuramyl-(pentapeptide) pyrophosphoryl-undecaprenol N-acetylglucosamine transferase [Corynebacterium guangdongense]
MSRSTHPTVILAGGGTAGHVEPALAIGEALVSNHGARVEAFGTTRGLETSLVPARGFQLHLITPVPVPRRISLDLLKLPFRLVKSVGQARRVLKQTAADAVVGTGGYVSAPAYLAARTLGLPFYVVESNALAGVSNKLGVRLGGVGFNAVAGSGMPGEVVGIPVRPGLGEDPDGQHATRARNIWNLAPDRPTILVTGGSQGAQSINDAIVAARERLVAEGFQILHAYGKKNEAPAELEHYVGVPYIEDMAAALAVADMAICRAGAMTVAEVTAARLPALYVPLPHGNGEQARNADEVVAASAARRIRDEELTADLIVETVRDILGDGGAAAQMRKAFAGTSAGTVAEDLAARIVADIENDTMTDNTTTPHTTTTKE